MIIYVDKKGKVLREANKTVERQDKNGKSLGSSSGMTIAHEDKSGNVVRTEKVKTPKAPRKRAPKK
tara:strand:- start:907 stop:1104 length:198 start_codon:yes stop_codon:yes gene_type:complete